MHTIAHIYIQLQSITYIYNIIQPYTTYNNMITIWMLQYASIFFSWLWNFLVPRYHIHPHSNILKKQHICSILMFQYVTKAAFSFLKKYIKVTSFIFTFFFFYKKYKSSFFSFLIYKSDIFHFHIFLFF